MSIKVLCRTRPKEAEQAVYDFAVFLRGNMNALESARDDSVSGKNVKTIERYLHIEKMRFWGASSGSMGSSGKKSSRYRR